MNDITYRSDHQTTEHSLQRQLMPLNQPREDRLIYFEECVLKRITQSIGLREIGLVAIDVGNRVCSVQKANLMICTVC